MQKIGGPFLWELFAKTSKNLWFFRGGPRFFFSPFFLRLFTINVGNTSSRCVKIHTFQPPNRIFRKATFWELFSFFNDFVTFWRFSTNGPIGSNSRKLVPRSILFLNLANWLGKRLVPNTALGDQCKNDIIRQKMGFLGAP